MPRRRRGWRPAPAAPLLLVTALGLGLAACGARTRPLSVYRTYPPARFLPFGLARYGIGFVRPDNWSDLADQHHRPVVAILASGPSVIAVSSYARGGAPPLGTTGADGTRIALLRAIRARQPAFQLLDSRTLTVDGHPAVQITGIELIHHQRRQVRSEHVYLDASEVVVEEYAPVSMFATVDREVFARVTGSIRVLPRTGAT